MTWGGGDDGDGGNDRGWGDVMLVIMMTMMEVVEGLMTVARRFVPRQLHFKLSCSSAFAGVLLLFGVLTVFPTLQDDSFLAFQLEISS